MIYVPSGIRKPFAFLDQAIIQAFRRLKWEVAVVPPGERFELMLQKLTKQWNPRFLLAMHGEKLTSSQLQLIGTLQIPTAVWYTDDPYAIDQSAKSCSSFDFVFTNESAAIPVYRQKWHCKQVFPLALAAPVSSYRPMKKVGPKYRSQLVFVGCAFENRLRAMKKIANRLNAYKTRLIGPGWQSFAGFSRFDVRNEWVTAKEVCQYYNGAEIVLNLHRAYNDPYLKQNSQKVRAYTPNNRCFEISACNAFQIVDYREEIAKYYLPNREIIVVHSPEELLEKIRFYLSRPHLRRQIAERAYQRTLKEHQYEHRLKEMISRIF